MAHTQPALTARRYQPLIEVRHYDLATWRYAIGHPRSGQVSKVELYERAGLRQSFVYDTHRQQVRIG